MVKIAIMCFKLKTVAPTQRAYDRSIILSSRIRGLLESVMLLLHLEKRISIHLPTDLSARDSFTIVQRCNNEAKCGVRPSNIDSSLISPCCLQEI